MTHIKYAKEVIYKTKQTETSFFNRNTWFLQYGINLWLIIETCYAKEFFRLQRSINITEVTVSFYSISTVQYRTSIYIEPLKYAYFRKIIFRETNRREIKNILIKFIEDCRIYLMFETKESLLKSSFWEPPVIPTMHKRKFGSNTFRHLRVRRFYLSFWKNWLIHIELFYFYLWKQFWIKILS